MTTRLLSGIIVEKTEYDLNTGGIVDRYCEEDPDDCCSLPTCLGNLSKTLYYSPRTLYCDGWRAPVVGISTSHAYKPFYQMLEFVYGANAVETYFPFPIHGTGSDPDVFPRGWTWTNTLQAGNYSGPVGTWVFPFFRLSVQFAITQASISASCVNHLTTSFSFVASSPPGNTTFWGINGDFRFEYWGGTPTSAPSFPDWGESVTLGYQQYNPYSNYLEFLPEVSVGDPEDELDEISGLPTATHQILTGEPYGYELPPMRTNKCPQTQMPPTLRATISGYPVAGMNTQHVMEWKFGQYHKRVVIGSERYTIEVYPYVTIRTMWGCAIRAGTNVADGAERSVTHSRAYGKLKVQRCFPFYSRTDEMNFAGLATPNMTMIVEEF